jgi:hypothetical protein
MSIDRTLSKLKFDASNPEIAEIEKDIQFALDGRHKAEAIVALARIMGDLIADAAPEIRGEMLRRVAAALAARVAQS